MNIKSFFKRLLLVALAIAPAAQLIATPTEAEI